MLPVDQRKDWIKSRRRKRKNARGTRLRRQLFRLFLLVSIVSVCFAGFAYLPWSVSDSDHEIIVKGNHFTATEQIRKVLMDALYTPVFELDPKAQEKRVEALETINNAFVRRYAFPRPHVVVEVLEEQPWASLGYDPAQPIHSVIAESGRMIPIKKFPRVTVPALKIYGSSNLKMTALDVKQWATWVSYIEKQTKDQVEFVDMRKPFDVNVQTKQLVLKLGIPDTALTQRLGRLTTILPTLRQYKDSLEYVDLALDNNIPLKISKAKLEASKAAEKEAQKGGAKQNGKEKIAKASVQEGNSEKPPEVEPQVSSTSTPL